MSTAESEPMGAAAAVDSPAPRKKSKPSPYIVECKEAAIFGRVVKLRSTGKDFPMGNLYAQGAPVRVDLKVKIAKGYEFNDEYGYGVIACNPEADTPETAATIEAIDRVVRQVVIKAGGVPSEAKHYKLLRDNGWVNFKIKDTTTQAWDEVVGGTWGTLHIEFKGIWRSQDGNIPDGYGAVVKTIGFTADE